MYKILIGLATAIGGGLLIGVERERRKGAGPRRAQAGVRTFALVALAGAVVQLSGHRSLVFAGAVLIVALTVIGYARQQSRDPGVTSEVALFVAYLIGVIAMDWPAVAAGGAVVVATLLVSRTALHRFSVALLSETELRDGLLLCGAALIVLPLLPEQGAALLPGINFRRLWELVVLFITLQALGYVAVRVFGPRLGWALSGLASGFVSSTTAIAALGVKARATPELLAGCVSAALFSNVATVLLLAVVVTTVNPVGLRLLGPSLAAGLVASVAVALLSLRRGAHAAAALPRRGRAFNLWYASIFALLLSAVTGALAYLTGHLGHLAFTVGVGLAGFVDTHAAAASALSVALASPIEPRELLTAVLLAFTANTVSKLVAALSVGGMAYGSRVATDLVLIALAMWAPLLWR